jgi:predicted choloylglycine hydrolase
LTTITLHTFSGNHYEIGVQQGRAVRELLHKGLEQIPDFEVVKLMKPRLLPTSLFLALAKRRAAKMLKNDIFRYYPEQAQRLKGIAEGAGIDISWGIFVQLMELLITVGPSSFRVSACTSLGFSPQRTKTRETIIAKNFDYPNYLAPYHLTCQTKPKERYQTLGCTMVSSPGMIDGMNEYGLTVTYNHAYATDEPKHFVPISLALQEMLETCKNTDEAVKFITQAKRAGNALLMIADREGNIKTVEISSNHAATHEMIGNQIINTNHYHTPEMQKHEIPRNAVFFGKVPKDILGKRVHESSEQRLKRAQELLKGKTKIDESKIGAILRDHGKDNEPSMLTICAHSEVVSTLRSVIFYPNRKTIKVLIWEPMPKRICRIRVFVIPNSINASRRVSFKCAFRR